MKSLKDFNPDELSPLLGQLCAIKIPVKKGLNIGIGKLSLQERKLTIYFERAAHLKRTLRLWPLTSRNGYAGMMVIGTMNGYTMHFQIIGINLAPKDWQRVMTDRGEIFLSFGENEIMEIDTFLDFHAKNRP